MRSALLAITTKAVDMCARSVAIRLKPNSVAEFTQMIEKEKSNFTGSKKRRIGSSKRRPG